jgi:hypothetical protein
MSAHVEWIASHDADAYVKTPDFRILWMLSRLCTRYGKTWVHPWQKTLLEMVQRFTGRGMSKRTLSRHVGALVRDGWLFHKLRHRQRPDGSLQCRASLYALTKRTMRWLHSLGANLWGDLWGKCGQDAKPLTTLGMTLLAESTNPTPYFNPEPAAYRPPRT